MSLNIGTRIKEHNRRYSRLSQHPSPNVLEPATPLKPLPLDFYERRSHRKTVFWFITYILAGLVGVGLGVLYKQWEGTVSTGQYMPPAGTVQLVWQRNHTFTGPSSPKREKAWDDIMPLGKGFVTHPRLAKKGRSVAAFHALHCLHGIQISYEKRVNDLRICSRHQTPSFNNVRDKAGADLHVIDHVDHCFDYLRQSLMCSADSNLESLDETGDAQWGPKERTCRDFGKLKDWTEKWRDNEETGILSGNEG